MIIYSAIRIATEANKYSYLILMIKYKYNTHVHKTDILIIGTDMSFIFKIIM